LLAGFDISVVRLVRVAIGDLLLGELAKGQWRRLTGREIESLQELTSKTRHSEATPR
jgi:23S rRNA pseudouridine2605 synthase